MSLLEVRNLRVRFDTPGGPVWPVDQVSFDLDRGELVALLGETGAGKSTTALAVLGLLPRAGGSVETGEVSYGGRNLLTLDERELAKLRGSELALVFQDAAGALDPCATVGAQIAEVLELHRGLARREAWARAAHALGDMGLPEPETLLASFPHELTPERRRRVLIALALVAEPRVIVADQPTAGLDPALAAAVLELLRRERERRGAGVVLLDDDVELVAAHADRVHVLHAGRVVEQAPAREIFAAPWHPYTAALWRARARLDGERPRRLPSLPGTAVAPAPVPPGCAVHPRCELARERCRSERPELSGVLRDGLGLSLRAGRRAACFEKEHLAAARGEEHEA